MRFHPCARKRSQQSYGFKDRDRLKRLPGRQVETRRAIVCMVVPSQLKPSGTGRRSLTLQKGCPLSGSAHAPAVATRTTRRCSGSFQDSACSEIHAYLLAQVNSLWTRTQAEVRATFLAAGKGGSSVFLTRPTATLCRGAVSFRESLKCAANAHGGEQSLNVPFNGVMSRRKKQKFGKSRTLHLAKGAPAPCEKFDQSELAENA